jgi:hypothetical protein
MSGCKIIRVKNLLGELLHMPGGISRDEAVGEAQRLIDELRGECEQAIPGEITMLEDLAALVGPTIDTHQLSMLLNAVGPLLTLTGTFGPPSLDAVVKRLCDLCAGMRVNGITDMAPVRVHLRAMRLLWNTGLNESQIAEVLGELQRIHSYYGIAARAPQGPEDLEAALAGVTA